MAIGAAPYSGSFLQLVGSTATTAYSEGTVTHGATLFVCVFDSSGEIVETHEITLSLDTTTKPTITPVHVDLDCGEPITALANIDLYRAYLVLAGA